MQQTDPTSAPDRSPNAVGVHSLDHFAIDVPNLDEASRFYSNFGLDVQAGSDGLHLHTFGHAHRWGLVCPGPKKRLRHLSFGAFADDFTRLCGRLKSLGIDVEHAPPTDTESDSVWFRDCDGTLVQLRVAKKSSPDERSVMHQPTTDAGARSAPTRNAAAAVRPRRLAHILLFTPNVHRTVAFYEAALGLRLSDEAGGIVAFMHAIHGSDHHLLAFAKSNRPGFHHCSWDVASVQEVGLGAMQMARAGYTRGWGLGQHVLGANYFHYIRDPWGSHSEYSAGMDYIPAGMNWNSASYEAENGFYLWGPEPPSDFTTNFEAE